RLFRAEDELQVLDFLPLHREKEQTRNRLFELLLRQNLLVQNLLERVLLLALLHSGHDAAGVSASAGADPARSSHPDRPAHAPSSRRLRALAAWTVRTGNHQCAAARDLARRHGLALFAVLIRPQNEIVAIDRDLLPVLRFDFDLRDDEVP